MQRLQLGCSQFQIAVSQMRLRMEFALPQILIRNRNVSELQDRSMDEDADHGRMFEMS